MAALARRTIQRLAILRAVSLWGKGGAYGPLRVQKTLFFAGSSLPDEHFFTFEKGRHGQYSDEVTTSLNVLKRAGKIDVDFAADADRIYTTVPASAANMIISLFEHSFSTWNAALLESFSEWGYKPNSEIYQNSHAHPSYTDNAEGAVLCDGSLPEVSEIQYLSSDDAESLSDLVDPIYQRRTHERMLAALDLPNCPQSNWQELFSERD